MSELLIYGLIAAIGSVLGSTISSITNGVSNKQTNETNKQLAEEANAAQAAESEKAYQRSLPTNQVANLRAAGMSHAGALNALNGGGSYTPAAVNTAQMQSFHLDNPLQGASDIIAGIGSNVSQQKQNQKQFDATIDFQKQQHQDELNENKRVNDAEINNLNSQTAAQQYHLVMDKLKDNPEAYNAVGRLSILCDASKYSSAFDYLQAVKSAAGDDAVFLNNPGVSKALSEQWKEATSGKLTIAQTGKTSEETKSVKSSRKIAERASQLDDLLKRADLDIKTTQARLLDNQLDHDSEIWKFTSDEMQYKLKLWTHQLSKAESDADLARINADIANDLKQSNIDVAKAKNELDRLYYASKREVINDPILGATWFVINDMNPIRIIK